IYGSAKIASFYRKALGMQQQQINQIGDVTEARAGVINVINVVGEECKVEPGQSTKEAGAAAFAALERAVADVRADNLDAIVTAPINKDNIQSELFTFPGHTEYLEASTDGKALMVLFNRDIRVALVTTHLPISKIAENITLERIVEKLGIFRDTLRSDFAIVHPRIAVLALNPHAGENGLLGTEEQDTIIPAIKAAKEQGVECYGPYAADGFFGSGLFKHFDGILAMYHDQGLAPFKTMAMESGVNFTAGLPIVRTSPDHGTGYDIAGQGKASEQSMREALYAAIDIARNRARHKEMTANPLRRQYFDKSKDNVVLDLTKE
ncbi:MAG: 4-hydroxythreonine-4-phosphate dehydrogenase PdxA, partial [Muribaculaceae bacterium]|nr:4-hydroxythreonine-4-phosphate dehydrogenase PdxA [Muribaculaceae bacterium]